MIYLDNAATTAVYPEAADATTKIYTQQFFNPSATYRHGIEIKRILEKSREEISKLLGGKSKNVYFTSCATESNNWVLSTAFKAKNANLVVSSGEHASVFERAKAYKASGLDVRFAPLDRNGNVNVEKLLSLVDENTSLVSILHASNETGVVNDVERICCAVKEKNHKTLFHSDGVQAFLKFKFNVDASGIDFYSISGHKVGAPKGIGLLYAKRQLQPMLLGGGQESGFRSGTENVAGIISLNVAAREFVAATERANVTAISSFIETELKKISGVKIIGENSFRTGYVTCFTAEGTRAEVIQTMCCDKGLIVGRGSACSSKHRGNRVLQEMGLSLSEIDGALRLSYRPENTKEEAFRAVDVLKECIEKMRGHKIG